MAFVQVIDFSTSQYDELMALDAQWRAATEGKRTLRRSIVARDRKDPNHYLVFAFFDDYESAMANSQLPATGEFAAKQQALADGPATFLDLDILDDSD
jgi:quinol monooxygenase YgiN